ncbi:MAG: HAMP domain-containing protein [Firmicutes bacterium]|nr:HAMP domain-containing protein [Bacillota bacterium]
MRLRERILSIVLVVVLGVGAAAAAALVHLQRAAGLRQVELAAQTLASTIYHGLALSMIRNNPDEIGEILQHLQGEPMVRRIDVITSDGRLWASSESADVGRVGDYPEVAQVVATGQPLVREVAEAGALLAVQPVQNGPSCLPCHAGQPPILGAVSVSLDTRRLYDQVVSSTMWLVALVAVSMVVVVVALGLPISRLLLRPLAALVAGVERIAAGDYAARVAWRSHDELGLLARAFNDMAERIQRHTTGLQREVGQLTRWLSGLHLFGRTLAESERLEDALAQVVEETGRLVRSDACAIVLSDGQAPTMARQWGAAELLREGEPPAVRLELPLVVKERRYGHLVVARRSGPAFSPEDVTLLEAVANLVAIAVENLRLFDEVREKERLRGRLLTRVMGAQEEERRRSARELHDSVGQSLTAIMLRIDWMLQVLRDPDGQLARRLGQLRQLAEATLEDVRRITYDLRPAALDDLSLAAAVIWYARTHLEPAGLTVVADVDACADLRLPPSVEIAVFRVAQEAVTNVLRHAGARRVEVRIHCQGDADQGTVEMTIVDDGRGFVPAEVMARRDRPPLGLLGMRERMDLVGGQLEIVSSPGQGTRVEVRVPFKASA